MKKYYSLFILLGLVIGSCGGSNTPKDRQEEKPMKDGSSAGLSGKELIEKSDCSGCHKEKDKLVGPSYTGIALKYQNQAQITSMLAEKVIKGGKGNWGEIPMTAHPQISEGDAETMVNYILSLKKQ